MTPAFLRLVVRHAEGLANDAGCASDADLVHSLASERKARRPGDRPFAELLHRHGPMVWATCRQLLPVSSDAEDAFQATFVALLRSAAAVRNPAAIGSWLHGVAVNVATKLNRTAVRRKQREQKAARSEPDCPVPDASWEALQAVVHEEIERLPADLRTAFVTCELQGVPQPEAANRLGWKPGTLTGRLTRARQALLQRLQKRGIAPAGAAVTVTFGTAASALSPHLIDNAMTFTAIDGTVPSAILKLVKEVTPMFSSQTKLLAAVLMTGGLALGLGSSLTPGAQAQPAGAAPQLKSKNDPAPTTGRLNLNTLEEPQAEAVEAEYLVALAPTAPGAEYHFVGKPRSALELAKLLEERSRGGWEMLAITAFDNAELRAAAKERPQSFSNISPTTTEVIVLKKRHAMVLNAMAPMAGNGNSIFPPALPGKPALWVEDKAPRMTTPAAPTTPSRPGTAFAPATKDKVTLVLQLRNVAASDVAKVVNGHLEKQGVVVELQVDPRTNNVILSGNADSVQGAKLLIQAMDSERSSIPTAVPVPTVTPGMPLTRASNAAREEEITVLRLKHAQAPELVTVLTGVFSKEAPKITVEERTNSLIIRTDAVTLKKVTALIEELDTSTEGGVVPPKIKR